MAQIKRLIVCCDGTWNDSVSTNNPLTNVARFSHCVEERTNDGILQIVYYHTGVGAGTSRISNSIDGAVGRGLGANVRNAYNFICQNFNHKDGNDEIILVGFSTGAFTVRCVASIIDRVGILTRRGLSHLYRVYGVWKDASRDETALETLVLDLKDRGLVTTGVKIKACGVWDTVSAMGVQLPAWLPQPPAKTLSHVDNKISHCIENAFHAMALDERRSAFWPLPWSEPHHTTNFRQCWFLGSHSDVGGGNEDAGLAKVAFIWMVAQFQHFTSVSFDETYLQDMLVAPVMEHVKTKEIGVNAFGSSYQKVHKTKVTKGDAGTMSDSFTWLWQLLGKRPRKPGRPSALRKLQYSNGASGAKDDLEVTPNSISEPRLDSEVVVGDEEAHIAGTPGVPVAQMNPPLQETHDTIHFTVRVCLTVQTHTCRVLKNFYTAHGAEQADSPPTIHWHPLDSPLHGKKRSSMPKSDHASPIAEADMTPEEKTLLALWLDNVTSVEQSSSKVKSVAAELSVYGVYIGGWSSLGAEHATTHAGGMGDDALRALKSYVGESVPPTLMYNEDRAGQPS